MSSTKASWTGLPPSVRHQILDLLLLEGRSLTGFATVSREWQGVIEPYTFARITLTPSRLAHSEAILSRKRSLVRYIWLRFELERYDCTLCATKDPDLWGMSGIDSEFVMESFQSLFSALSQWEPSGDLILDISVYSPSDPSHWFKYLDLEPDIPPAESSFPPQPPAWFPADDPSHGWIGGRQETAPNSDALEKPFEEIMCQGPFEKEELEMQWWRGLPPIPAITGVLLRQQTRRRWRPNALAAMFGRLPNLKEVCYEPWREWAGMEQCTDQKNKELIVSLGQGNLRRLVIFENFNEHYPPQYMDCDPVRPPNAVLSLKLARASLQLEALSASYMVDASYFFQQACIPYLNWPNLRSLALTSWLLDPSTRAANIDGMLLDAATVVLKMPKLETMEIWNGREGLAVLFRYQASRAGQPAVITLRGTFKLALRPAVARAWIAVAGEHRVVVRSSSVDASIIRSHGDAICHLGLSAHVVRPVSLRQILKEHRARAEGVLDKQM
ncbi:hypothetical protein AK830_g6876 [Neonectria ditissima]|uniref:DUF6546 domain-containing protein n=1 Tax=Neonectria ditissima TaxID=78410 RepID=A0A0P7BFG2_9HYPO|nr:hypothetical protein AK830_g6876 [Neonectria ditissima]